MNHAVTCSASRPDQEQQILPIRIRMRRIHKLLRRSHRMAIHFKNHVTRSKARIIGRATRANALNRNPLHLRRNMQLLPHIRS